MADYGIKLLELTVANGSSADSTIDLFSYASIPVPTTPAVAASATFTSPVINGGGGGTITLTFSDGQVATTANLIGSPFVSLATAMNAIVTAVNSQTTYTATTDAATYVKITAQIGLGNGVTVTQTSSQIIPPFSFAFTPNIVTLSAGTSIVYVQASGALSYNQFVTNLLNQPVNIHKIVFTTNNISDIAGKNLRAVSTNIMGQKVVSPYPLSSSISPYQYQAVVEYNADKSGTKLVLDAYTYFQAFKVPANTSFDVLMYFNYSEYSDVIKGINLQDGLQYIRTIKPNETIE